LATFDGKRGIALKRYKICIVSSKVKYENVYAVSNGYVVDNLG